MQVGHEHFGLRVYSVIQPQFIQEAFQHMKIFNNTQDRNHKQDLNFIIRKQAPDTNREADLE
jgi:hypothetical protein